MSTEDGEPEPGSGVSEPGARLPLGVQCHRCQPSMTCHSLNNLLLNSSASSACLELPGHEGDPGGILEGDTHFQKRTYHSLDSSPEVLPYFLYPVSVQGSWSDPLEILCPQLPSDQYHWACPIGQQGKCQPVKASSGRGKSSLTESSAWASISRQWLKYK